jgi:hypothetical protein
MGIAEFILRSRRAPPILQFSGRAKRALEPGTLKIELFESKP